MMNEIPLLFGPERNLFGTFALPKQGTSKQVAILLFNAGVIHHIGPHRINVKIARRLFDLGYSSLRFDLSGQGDSRPATSGGDFQTQSRRDIQAAMDHVERTTGIKQFVLAGICSGAHHSVSTAREDSRVVGLWLMDGYMYPTAKTYILKAAQRLKGKSFGRIVSWIAKKVVANAGDGVRRLRASKSSDEVEFDYGNTSPSRKAYAETLQKIVARGVNVHLAFSGSVLDYYNYSNQYKDMFSGYEFVNKITCEFSPHIDHTITLIRAQEEVLRKICEFVGMVDRNRNLA